MMRKFVDGVCAFALNHQFLAAALRFCDATYRSLAVIWMSGAVAARMAAAE
jgi:hypothetical protein